MLVSVVIPTYNRSESLRRLLQSLGEQTLDAQDELQVVVVDDGSTDETPQVVADDYPFRMTCLRQRNAGATAARNAGAVESAGQMLVFVDDDITLPTESLAALVRTCRQRRCVAIGTLVATCEVVSPLAQLFENTSLTGVWAGVGEVELDFSACRTGLLAVQREDFLALGMFQDPTGGGWPNWDDVYFGYRAHLHGIALWQSGAAVAFHWDHALSDLAVYCRRWQRAGASAARLFEACPAIAPHLPMFHDKLPIAWRDDPPRLVLRKLARGLLSSRPALAALQQAAVAAEGLHLPQAVLSPLYRWTVGAHLYHGLRQGLRSCQHQPSGLPASRGSAR